MLAVLLALVSGAPALAYQVVWTRQVALAAGSQVEAISAVLAAFSGGLALGARLLGPRADRVASPLRLYALLEIGAGALAAGTLLPLAALAGRAADLATGPALLIAAACLLPATTLLGGTVPALLRASSRAPADSARHAGWIVGANTFGSVAGVALSAWAIPRLGLAETLIGAAVGSLAVGVVALVAASRRARPAGPAPGKRYRQVLWTIVEIPASPTRLGIPGASPVPPAVLDPTQPRGCATGRGLGETPRKENAPDRGPGRSEPRGL